MKKWLSVLVLMLFGLALVSCDETTPEEKDTVKPMIVGVADVEITVGDAFDPKTGITATDDVDGNITSSIKITGTYDVNVVGTYTLTYKVADKAGNEAVKERKLHVIEAYASDLRIVNGDFSQALEGAWTHWAGDGGISTVSIVDGVAVIDIKANGSQWYSTQFNQPGLTITQGKMYKLEFDGKADIARGIAIKIEDPSYAGYIDETFELSTTMTRYSVEFFVTKASITNAKLVIGMGTMVSRGLDAGALTKVYLDNFMVTEVNAADDTEAPVIKGATDKNIEVNQSFDNLQGVTVSDNRDFTLKPEDIVITGSLDITKPGEYILTYKLTDASGNVATVERKIVVLSGLVPSTLKVNNGDFSLDAAESSATAPADNWHWKTGWQVEGNFTAKIENGMAIFNIINPGTVVHGVQFFQLDRIIEQGQIYKISFRAKADIPRSIMFALEEGTSRRYDEIVDLSTEWETYEIQVEYVLSSMTNGKFAFFLGDVGDNAVPTTIYFDDVEIVTVKTLEDTKAPQLYGLYDYQVLKGSTFDPILGVTLRDNMDSLLTLLDVVITGTVNTAVVGQYDLTYTVEDASGNSASYTRTISVMEAANMNDNTFIVSNSDFAVDHAETAAEAAGDNWRWKNSGTGAFTAKIEEGIATIKVTALGTVPHGVQFFQQDRIIETGATYKLTFKAKADNARSLRLSLEAGTNVRFFELIDITTEWVTYEVYMVPTGGGFSNGKLGFFMGYIDEESMPTTFYLDDVNIQLVGHIKDLEKPMIFGHDDVAIDIDSMFDPLAGLSLFDLVDKTLKVEDIVVTGTVDTAVAGKYVLTYTLTDASGNQAVETREVTVLAQLLPSTIVLDNADFEVVAVESSATAPTDNWHWKTGTGGAFTAKIENGIAVINVLNPGSVAHGIQFFQLNRTVTQGQVYKITFKAKADMPRSIMFALEQGWTRRYDEVIDLGSEWATYEIYIDHTGEGYTNGKFAFFMGDVGDKPVPTTIYLDDVVITTVRNVVDHKAPQVYGLFNVKVLKDSMFNPLQGLSIRDNVDKELSVEDLVVTGDFDISKVGIYTLTYKAVDTANNMATFQRTIEVVEQATLPVNTFIVSNPDFAVDHAETAAEAAGDNWRWKNSGTGAFTAKIEEGIATINVTALGTVPHGVQFFQEGRIVVKGATYKLTFKAKADIPRSIRLSLEAGTDVRFFKVVNITDEWVTYEVLITPTGASFTNGKLGFFIGLVDDDSFATKVYLDDVSIEIIGFTEDNDMPYIFGATDVTVLKDSTFNPLAGISVFDLADNSLKPESIVITGTVDTALVGDYTLTYTLTDAFGNEVVKTRVVTVA